MNNQSTDSVCKIALDAMGGDFAPRNEVHAAVQVQRDNPSLKILLVGKEKDILNILYRINFNSLKKI